MMAGLSALARSGAEAFAAQRDLLAFLYKDPRFRAPLIVIWVASFGGALHSSVTTYFYLKVGASETDIGWIGFFFHAGSLFMPPLYGYLLDRSGGYIPMLICVTLCAVGCLVRGLASEVTTLYIAAAILGLGGFNLWNVVLSYLSANTPDDRRSLVVSGFLFQVTSVRIVGTSVYPLWYAALSWLLPGDDAPRSFLRDQISMGVCTFFCFFGLFELLLFGGGVRTTRPAGSGGAAVDVEAVVTSKASKAGRNKQQQPPPRSPSPAATGKNQAIGSGGSVPESPEAAAAGRAGGVAAFAVSALALVAQAASATIGSVLWPLYVRDAFGWESTEFAYALLLSSCCSSAAIAALPTLERELGPLRTAVLATFVASFAAVAAFGTIGLPYYDHEQLQQRRQQQALAAATTAVGQEGVEAGGDDDWEAGAGTALPSSSWMLVGWHVTGCILFFGALALLEPSLKSLAS